MKNVLNVKEEHITGYSSQTSLSYSSNIPNMKIYCSSLVYLTNKHVTFRLLLTCLLPQTSWRPCNILVMIGCWTAGRLSPVTYQIAVGTCKVCLIVLEPQSRVTQTTPAVNKGGKSGCTEKDKRSIDRLVSRSASNATFNLC